MTLVEKLECIIFKEKYEVFNAFEKFKAFIEKENWLQYKNNK